MNIWKDVIETDKAFNKIEHSFMALKKKKTANLEAQLVGKESACSAGDLGLISPGSGRSPGEGNGNPLE